MVTERSDHPSCDPHILLPTFLGTEDIKAGLLKAFLTDLVFHMKFCTDNSGIRNLSLQWGACSKHSMFDVHCLEQTHKVCVWIKIHLSITFWEIFITKLYILWMLSNIPLTLFYANSFWGYCFLECKQIPSSLSTFIVVTWRLGTTGKISSMLV